MSFIDSARLLPKLETEGIKSKDALALIKQLQETLRVIEGWLNDLATTINSNAGAPEVVDGFADLPPVAEAVGRMYFLQLTATPGPAPPAGKRFVASDGTNWLALD